MLSIFLGGDHYDVAGSETAPRIRRGSRPSQPADAGVLTFAEWRTDGHDFDSFERIGPGQEAGFLGRCCGVNTDGRWFGFDTLGPKVNTLDLSTYDQPADIVHDANCSAVANAVWATSYQYVGRGTRPAKIDLSDMSLKDGGAVLPREVSDLVVTVGEVNEVSLAVADALVDSDNLDLARDLVFSPDGNYAYVIAQNINSITVVDVSDPTNLTVVGTVQDDTNLDEAVAICVHPDGEHVYVACQPPQNRLTVVDVTDPTDPTVAGSVQDNTNLLIPNGVAMSPTSDHVYVISFTGDRLTVVDVSDPSDPTVAGSVMDGTSLDFPVAVDVNPDGDYAFVACVGNRVTSVSVSNPASPSVTDSLQDGTNLPTPSRLKVSKGGNAAYVVSSSGERLTVIDISNPASLSVDGSVTDDLLAGVLDVAEAQSGDYVYTWSSTDGVVSTIDVSTPSSPSLVDSLTSASLFAGDAGWIRVSPVEDTVLVTNTNNDSLVSLLPSNLEIAAGQGDYAAYQVLPVSDIANPVDATADAWAANDADQPARVFGLAPDRVVGMYRNVIAGNILAGATSMADPAWNTVATIETKQNRLRFTGFAMDGNLWIPGTNDGPYVLDSDTRKFYPLMPELSLSEQHCRNMAEWFPVGVVMPLENAIRYQKYGAGESFGVETFMTNTSQVQGTPTAWTASDREGYEIRYNPDTGDSWLIAWREREPGDGSQHEGGILSPYVIARFEDKRSNFLEWLGTVDGIRTNPTLSGGYGSDYFWLTCGRTTRWPDDPNYRYASSGFTTLTELRRLRNVLADIERVELEVRRSDGGDLDDDKTVTVSLSLDGGSFTQIGETITEAGYHTLYASSGGVPTSTFHGVRRIKPRLSYSCNADTVSPQVVGPIRVYYRTRPTTIPVTTYTLELNGSGAATPEEQETALRDLIESGPVELQDLDNRTVYVRVTNVVETKTDNRGSGRDRSDGLRRTVDVTVEEWAV